MSLINGLLALLGEIESDAIAVHEERCISVRNRNADCLRCVEACTSGALAYRAGELLVEPERCIGCGTCATACPTCAIELRNPTDAELTAQLKHSIVATKGHPVIVCEQALEAANVAADDASAACAVPCLGRMDESALVGLAAYRAFDATLACGSCETCPHAPGGALVREVVEGARNLLEAFGSSMPIDLEECVPERVLEPGGSHGQAGSDGVGRRDFFRSAKDASTRAAGAAVAEELGMVEAEPVLRRIAKWAQMGRCRSSSPRAACGCTTTCSTWGNRRPTRWRRVSSAPCPSMPRSAVRAACARCSVPRAPSRSSTRAACSASCTVRAPACSAACASTSVPSRPSR